MTEGSDSASNGPSSSRRTRSSRRRPAMPARRRTSSISLIGLGAAAVIGAVLGASAMMVLPRNDGPAAVRNVSGDESASGYTTGGAAGYLAPGVIQPIHILPPPPKPGSPEDAADKQIFVSTRALKGGPRWSLAQSDADQTVAGTLKTFSCALGADLGPASAPATDAMLERFARDQAPIIEGAKSSFNKPRPFLSTPGEICIPRSEELARSPDYPSGHAAWGWAVALILAEAAPQRADQLLARGRAYGESRVICGAHSASAVDAGRLVGASMVAAAHTSPAFRGDLDAVRMELASLLRSGKSPASCSAEAALAAPRP